MGQCKDQGKTSTCSAAAAGSATAEEPTGPSFGDSNQERLAELGLSAAPAGGAKSQLQSASDRVAPADTAVSSLGGVAAAFAESSAWVDGALEHEVEHGTEGWSPLLQLSTWNVPTATYMAESARYRGMSTRASALGAEDFAARAMHDDALRESAVLDEVLGEDGMDAALADADGFEGGLMSSGQMTPPKPTSAAAFEEVRRSTSLLTLAIQDAATATAELDAAAERRKAGAAQERIDEIEAFKENVSTVATIVGVLGGQFPKAEKAKAFHGFEPPRKSQDYLGTTSDYAGSVLDLALTGYFWDDLSDLNEQIGLLTERAAQLDLLAERGKLAGASQRIEVAFEGLTGARQRADDAVQTDRAAWQAMGATIDTRLMMSGDLAGDDEAALGAGLRLAKVEEVGQRLVAARGALAPAAERADGFAGEVRDFVESSADLATLTEQRQTHHDTLDVVSATANDLHSRFVVADTLYGTVGIATGRIAEMRARQS